MVGTAISDCSVYSHTVQFYSYASKVQFFPFKHLKQWVLHSQHTVCVRMPHGWSLLPCQPGSHGGGGGRLGSGTVGCRAQIKCDCDSRERRIKQQAMKD